jgi:hypothetical protein
LLQFESVKAEAIFSAKASFFSSSFVFCLNCSGGKERVAGGVEGC